MITGEDGRFTVRIADSSLTTLHLLARCIEFAPIDMTIALAGLDSVTIAFESVVVFCRLQIHAGTMQRTGFSAQERVKPAPPKSPSAQSVLVHPIRCSNSRGAWPAGLHEVRNCD